MADKVVGINRGSIYLTMEISEVKLREDKIEIINNPVVDYDKDVKRRSFSQVAGWK